MRLVLLSGGLVVCLSLCIYSRYHDREGRGRNTIAKTAIANITSITILNGHRQEPWRRMQCHATGREGVRGQDKHEKRRSGDLPIVAPPIPGRAFLLLGPARRLGRHATPSTVAAPTHRLLPAGLYARRRTISRHAHTAFES